MPERIGSSNMIKVFQHESFETTDGTIVKGPLIVRVHQIEELGILQIQSTPRYQYEVKGKTIEDFLTLVH